MKAALRIASTALEVLFPPSCVGCGTPCSPRLLCESCVALIGIPASLRCPVCDLRLPQGKVCRACRDTSCLLYCMAVGSFRNPVIRTAVHRLKYEFLEGLAEPLGALLGDTIMRYVPEQFLRNLTIVPLPLAPSRLRWRGFNHAEEIARHAGIKLSLPVAPARGAAAWLARYEGGKAQVGLLREARFENVRGKFFAPNPSAVKNRRILLVDDVLTSGATLFAAAAALRAAEAREVNGAVIARG